MFDLWVSCCETLSPISTIAYLLVIQYVVVLWSSIFEETARHNDLCEELACQCQGASVEETGPAQDGELNFCW